MNRQRKSILFADVTDSTALLEGADSESTLAAMVGKLQAALTKRNGQQFFTAGDGVGFLYSDSVAAAHAAADALEVLAREFPAERVRIGLHQGDVARIQKSHYGIDINIAARIQAQADPNTILASAEFARHLTGHPDFEFQSLGEVKLRGVTRPVSLMSLSRLRSRPGRTARRIATSVDLERGIAVLPFTIQAEEERWNYFADGVTEDLTANLSRFRSLTVISRHSSSEVAKAGLPMNEMSRRLGASFIVQGHIHVISDRFRITASLTDADRGVQVWSDKFDRPVGDLFAMIDEISGRLAVQLAAQIEHVGKQRVQAAHPESLESYELLLRGLECILLHTRQANGRARQCFHRAIKLDPGLARAYSALSRTYNLDWRYRWSKRPDRSIAMALELAQISTEMDRFDARAHGELGFAHLYRRELDEALYAYEEALDLNPNDADIMAEYADAMVYNGDPDACIDLVSKAMRLNPIHPDWYLWVCGGAQYQARRYDDAVATLKRMANPAEASRLLAASCARRGEQAEAERWAESLRQKHPAFTIEDWATTQPFRRQSDLEHFLEGMRQAGLK